MAERKMQRAAVVSQERIADQIYSMWLRPADDFSVAETPPHLRSAAACTGHGENASPWTGAAGQFVSLYSNDSGRMLPRPISICETDPERGLLRLVYRVAGKGTAEFASCRPGDSLDLIGPLGNGYPAERGLGRPCFLIGGGIGIPPMVELAKRLSGDAASRESGGKVQIIAGYRDELFLTKELAKYGELYLAVEAPPKSAGASGTIVCADGKKRPFTHGNVLDCIRENDLSADVIYACGPAPMLRAIKAYAQERQIECYLSLEERMACGIGACLACVCESAGVDEHSQVRNKRVCRDGPVFAAEDIVL